MDLGQSHGGWRPAAGDPLRLNRTFYDPPKYFPIIDAGMVYAIAGTSLVDRVLDIVFVTQSGVMPYDA